MKPRGCLLGFILLLVASTWAPAQSRCNAPVLAASTALNFLTEEQEVELGDIIAQQQQQPFRLLEDEVVVGNLRRIGDKLVRQLPPTKLRVEFHLIDLPELNAFAMPGGGVYVSRKLVALTRNEDELAGVMAHEMGHLLTRQSAQHWSRLFHDILGIDRLGDRADIEEKYHQFLESYRRNPSAIRALAKQSAHDQMQADQVAVYLLARAGYNPQAVADMFDRTAELQGRTGSWLSDLFNVNKPETRRLREVIKNTSAIPPECIEAGRRSSEEEYQKWRAAVVAYSASVHKEALHDVVLRQTLDPWLQGEVHHLKFSDDGKYVLAQDASSIFVLTHQPFAVLFRIDAQDAYPAQFTPDSRGIVFYTSGFRMEHWDIAEQQMQEAHEMYIRRGCLQDGLSPDGAVLACLQANEETFFPLDLHLLEVATGQALTGKKRFYNPGWFATALIWMLRGSNTPLRLVNINFSPDGRYLVVARGESRFAYDLKSRSEVRLSGSVGDLLGREFTFVGPDRLIGVGGNPKRSKLVRFPSGETIIADIQLGGGELSGASHGDTLIIRGLADYPVAVMDLARKKIFVVSRNPALDVFDNEYVNVRKTGEIGLYASDDLHARSTVQLPRSPLGHLHEVAVSPDFGMLGISLRDSGAIWNLKTGKRLAQVLPFRGAWFQSDHALYADFPPRKNTQSPSQDDESKSAQTQPGHTLARLDPQAPASATGIDLDPDAAVQQWGRYLLLFRPAKKNDITNRDVTLEVQDAPTATKLWTRRFAKGAPRISVDPFSNSMVLIWNLDDAGSKEIIKADENLRSRVERIKKPGESYLLEVVDARSGATRATLPVETGNGSFRVRDAHVAGDRVLVADNQNRVLVYTLAGTQAGRVFGQEPVFDAEGKRLCVVQQKLRLAIFDLDSMEKRDQFEFSSPVSHAWFSADGQRLAVLTSDQVFFVLKPAPSATAARRAPLAH